VNEQVEEKKKKKKQMACLKLEELHHFSKPWLKEASLDGVVLQIEVEETQG
jgi:hypothetical protein